MFKKISLPKKKPISFKDLATNSCDVHTEMEEAQSQLLPGDVVIP